MKLLISSRKNLKVDRIYYSLVKCRKRVADFFFSDARICAMFPEDEDVFIENAAIPEGKILSFKF